MNDLVLVTGATGFIGGHLVPALVDAGHQVRAMTRHPDGYDGPGEAVFGDVADPDSLPGALEGVRFAYYLVHSLDSHDFEERDAAAASAFGAAAAAAGVEQIVYLGGLGATRTNSRHTCARVARWSGCSRRMGSRDHAARRGDHRARRYLLGDHPATGEPAAGHGRTAVGPHPNPADRAGRCDPLPGRRARVYRNRMAGSMRSADRRCCATTRCSPVQRMRPMGGPCRSSSSRC